jgi:hypothetical protein
VRRVQPKKVFDGMLFMKEGITKAPVLPSG